MNTLASKPDGGETTQPQAEVAPLTALPLKAVASGGSKQTARKLWLMKKTVLLIDVDATTREARSKVMRTMGVTVHCAASVTGARQKLESGAYNLVLVNLGSDVEGAKSLVEEIRARNSRQLVAFLVGSPLFVAMSLDAQPSLEVRAPRIATALKPEPQSASAFDFGQRIRDAEAQ